MEQVIMVSLKAKYLIYGLNWAEVGDNVIVSENGDIATKQYVEDDFDRGPFETIVDSADDGVEVDIEDSVYQNAEDQADLHQRANEQYAKNPPKTFEEDLDYNFGGDDDSDEWIDLYENLDQSETNPS
jgi:phosphatidate phosphatase PAH1